jgi:hypothetical protein
MEKAARERFRLSRERQPRVREERAPTVRLEASLTRRGQNEVRRRSSAAPQAEALDALELLAEAARTGLAASRVARLEARVASGRVSVPSIERLERALRHWLDAVQL